MKTLQAPSSNPTFFESILIAFEIDPGMALAISLAGGIFLAGFLATVAVKRNWL
jgi:hypothetical protein